MSRRTASTGCALSLLWSDDGAHLSFRGQGHDGGVGDGVAVDFEVAARLAPQAKSADIHVITRPCDSRCV